MKTLIVQVQAERLSAPRDLATLIERVVALQEGAEARHGSDDGEWVDVYMRTEAPEILWARLERLLDEEPALAAASIIVAEGPEGGWDEYYLLHHFDPAETTNRFP